VTAGTSEAAAHRPPGAPPPASARRGTSCTRLLFRGNPDLMSRERPSDRTGGARKISEVHVHRPWPLPSQPWVLAQRWRDRLFAHWPVDPEHLRPLIPGGLTLECHTGTARVSITPFRLEGLRPIEPRSTMRRGRSNPSTRRFSGTRCPPPPGSRCRRNHDDGVRAAARCRGLGAASARGRRRRAPELVTPVPPMSTASVHSSPSRLATGRGPEPPGVRR